MSRTLRLIRRSIIKQRATIAAQLGRWSRETEGVAAVEFAMIAPIMALMVIGAIELSEAVTVDRRVSQVTSTTGDLVAQIPAFNPDTNGPWTLAQLRSTIGSAATIGAWQISPYEIATGADKLMSMTITGVRLCVSSNNCNVPPNPPTPTVSHLFTQWECTISPNADGVDATPICTCPATKPNFTGSAGLSPTTVRDLMQFSGGSNFLVVAKVEYKYRPRFFDTFLSTAATKTGGYYTYRDLSFNRRDNLPSCTP